MNFEAQLIPNYIYFYHVDKFCVLPMYPESIADQLNSSFGETNALSRSAPVFTYKNSGPRTVRVDLALHRDMMNDVNKNVGNLKDNVVDFSGDDYVDTLIKYLQSIALPRYKNYSSGSKSVIPPMIAIRFGNDIFIKGVVNGGVSLTYNKPILSNNKYACVDVSFTVSESDPYDADSVITEGSFRGITRSFKDGIYKDTSESPMIDYESLSSSNNVEDTPSVIVSNATMKVAANGALTSVLNATNKVIQKNKLDSPIYWATRGIPRTGPGGRR